MTKAIENNGVFSFNAGVFATTGSDPKTSNDVKQYLIEADKDVDLRKKIFSEFAKENITIFEMKKADTTLEDAFIKLIEGGNK